MKSSIISFILIVFLVATPGHSEMQTPIPPNPIAPPTPAPSPPVLSISGPTAFPEHTLAQYTVPNATGVGWMVFPIGNGSTYQTDNGVFIFTAPPGSYQLFAATTQNGNTIFLTLAVTVTPAAIASQPLNQPVSVVPTSNDQVPYVDVSDEVYRAISSSPSKSKLFDSKVLSNLYSFCAAKIELDGARPSPGLKSISQANLLIKSEQQALLDSTPLKSLKDVYPEISKIAADKFTKYISKYNDIFSQESRKAYVDFLLAIANGFDRASRIQ
jgi:hypothetical protein